MTEHTELHAPEANGLGQELPGVGEDGFGRAAAPGVTTPAPEARPEDNTLPQEEAAEPQATEEVGRNGDRSPRHVEAGRKGARRVHQLIEFGRLYEQEHGLKRGRQRLRQLIEEGRLYEEEHGLSPRRRRGGRPARVSSEQVLRRLLDALVRIARPSYRAQLLKLVEALEGAASAPTEAQVS